MNRLYFLALKLSFTLVLALAPTVQAQSPSENSSQEASLPLTIYLIHGLAGDHTTFGRMPELLDKYFNSASEVGLGESTTPKIRTKKIIYSTFSDTLTQVDFVTEVAQQIREDFRDSGLPENSPFMLVNHSQGGIISMMLLGACIRPELIGHSSSRPACGGPFPRNLVGFVTMGTPFWGSPMANFSTRYQWFARIKGIKIPQNQMLSAGSALMSLQRLRIYDALEKRPELVHDALGKDFKLVSILGNTFGTLRRFDFTVRLFSWLSLFDLNEDDIVVPATYGNPNFHYYYEAREVDKSFPSGFKILSFSGSANLSEDVYVTNHPHTNFPGRNKKFPNWGIASPDNSDHEAYQIVQTEVSRILEKLEGNPNPTSLRERIRGQITFESQRLREFSSDIEIIVPPEFRNRLILPESKIKTYVKAQVTNKDDRIETLFVENSFGALPIGTNAQDVKASKHRVVFFHSGRFSTKFAKGPNEPERTPTNICYNISIPGFDPKSFCTRISPGQSSFSRVILEPSDLIAPSNKLEKRLKLSEDILAGIYSFGDGYGIVTWIKHLGDRIESHADFRTVSSDEYKSIAKECRMAVVPQFAGQIPLKFYLSPDTKVATGSLRTGQTIEILGRISIPELKIDRYLALLPTNYRNQFTAPHIWVNYGDVDPTDEPCQLSIAP